MLLALPGVSVANRNNPTQDPRISIRGFGARSAFGVRGVRVVRDGIPLTLPDGQTPIDYLDLESVGRIEVIRGSAGSLYGNAAGGVVEVRTADPPRDVVAGRVTGYGGSYGLKRWAGAAGGTSGACAIRATCRAPSRTASGIMRGRNRRRDRRARCSRERRASSR